MQSGRTFIVIKDEGVLKRGMAFSFLCEEGSFIYLWSHKPLHGLNQIKFSKDVIKRNFRII